jgi:pilus assembly protein CpaF
MQEIFGFQQKKLDSHGNVRGTFRFMGIRPRFAEKFKMVGINLPQEILDPDRAVEV